MQVLAPTEPGRSPGTLLQAAFGLLLGAVLVVSGAVLAYVVLATSASGFLSVPIRPTPTQTVVGVVAWSLALIAPAMFVIAGLARMHGSAGRLRRPRRPATPVAQYAGHLSDELVTALRVRLPDGRLIPELVVGPFGVAVVSELPPSPAVRRSEGHWEIRFEDGRWVSIENPLDRTVRDSEHVRRWLADDDRDFLVKVYAAAVTPGLELDRTATCAVLRPEQVPAWLASLPPQRGLTAQRRERIVGLVSERVGAGAEPRR